MNRSQVARMLAILGALVVPAARAWAQPEPAGPAGWMASLLETPLPWLWALGAFLGGLALNLTPCVYPMIPVTVAFFSGQSPGRPIQTLRLAGLYVLGISLTYAALGSIAAASGNLLGGWLQQPVVLLAVAGLVVALSLSMFGLYELRPPRWITQRFGQASAGGAGALVMGLTVGVIAAPCIGPFVVSLLLLVGQTGNPWLGFLLFFIMGIGMGLPYVFLALFAGRMAVWPKAGAWLVWVKKLLGILLLGLALYFARPLVPRVAFGWSVVGWLLAAALYLGWIDRTPFPGARVWIKRGVGLVCAALALASIPAPEQEELSNPIAWQPFSDQRFEQARAQGRPVLIDVYADWCLPCVELDHVTFRNPQVVERLSAFVALRIDATREVPTEAQALLDRYGIYGVPTLLLFDPAGKEREELRILGFINAEEMLRRLAAASRT